MVESIEGSATMRVTHSQEARMRGDDRQQAGMWSYLSPEQRVSGGPSAAPDPGDGGYGAGGAVLRVREALLSGRPALDPSREAVAGALAASPLQHAERTAADGATGLPPALSLVRRAEHG